MATKERESFEIRRFRGRAQSCRRGFRFEDIGGNHRHVGRGNAPEGVDFSARLKERRKANARVVAMRACVSAAVIVVAGALVWLFFFSSVFRLESGNISVVGANEWVSESQVLDIAGQQAGKSNSSRVEQ